MTGNNIGIRLIVWSAAALLLLLGETGPVARAQALPAIPELASDPHQAEFGRNIPRTMSLLAQATPQRHVPVKILFYGQSITEQSWWQAVAKDLQTRFPNARLQVRLGHDPFSTQELSERFPNVLSTIDNQAIGGYGIPTLRRTAEHDVFSYYPDLIFLHAYEVNKDGSLDKLVADIRSRTTAEIVLATHHVDLFKRLPKYDDDAYRKANEEHQQRREKECAEIHRVAQKYGCELVEVRIPWEKYLQDNQMEPKALLGDNIHLNAQGCALMAKLVSPHFQCVEGATNPWSQCIQTQTVQPDQNGHIRVQFTGNRIDVIAAAAPPDVSGAAAKVLIDGRSPSENPDLYAITRPSKAPNAWYPAINRIGHNNPLVVEDWTLRLIKRNEDASEIEFEVVGSKTGPDGTGNSKVPFVSKSGRVVIEQSDWTVAGALKWFKKPLPDEYKVTWSVVPQFVDVYQPPTYKDPGRVRITTLAQGLDAGAHTLELIPEGNGKLAIEAVCIHCPPGRIDTSK